MAMNFWEAQRRARARTFWYVLMFTALTIGVAVLAEIAMRVFSQGSYDAPLPYIAFAFTAITFMVALIQYVRFKSQGGSVVAESVGAVKVDHKNPSQQVQRLLNIVEEMAVAAAIPVPVVYVLPADEINAFAAGMSPDDAIIAVTVGALNKLNRDELQGVVAHELGHIHNGDMLISMRIAAMVMGFFFILYIALRLVQTSNLRDGDEKRGNPLLLAALIFFAAGAFTWFAGSILKSMISRTREYLADASSVQYTRNPEGLANALRKISQESVHDMPSSGMAFSHMYFEDTSFMNKLFATHPPIEKRIAAIEGRKYIPEGWKIPG